MKLTKALTYTTTDGKTFADRKDAVARQSVIDRTARILVVLVSNEMTAADLAGAERPAEQAACLASIGVELLAALTLPSTRGPNKPKVAPAV